MAATDPTRRFSDRVGDYARHRPTYPREAVDAVVGSLGAGAWAADIGAGTGISTRLLLERGLSVHAVEPNAAMREQGERETGAFLAGLARTGPGDLPSVYWHATTGEATALPDSSVSLVLCAQSLHWLDAPRALREFARILTPGGRAVAVWNVHDVRDPFMSEYRDLVMRHARDVPRSPWFRNDACALGGPEAAAAGFSGYERRDFEMVQPLTMEGLIGRAASSSYMPKDGPARTLADQGLSTLFSRHQQGGVVSMRYVCEVHSAGLAAVQR